MEFSFYLFNKLGREMQVYNRMVIMSIIPTILISFYLYFNMDRINYIVTNLPRMTKIVEQVGIENISVLQESIALISNYYIFGAFFIVLLANFFLFLTLIPNTYKLWKISCYWIIPYILILWAHKYNMSVNVLFENNILEIIEWIYTLYGIKVIYNLTEKIGIKSNILKHGISMLLGLSYPMVAFVIGALASFEFIEIKEIRI